MNLKNVWASKNDSPHAKIILFENDKGEFIIFNTVQKVSFKNKDELGKHYEKITNKLIIALIAKIQNCQMYNIFMNNLEFMTNVISKYNLKEEDYCIDIDEKEYEQACIGNEAIFKILNKMYSIGDYILEESIDELINKK